MQSWDIKSAHIQNKLNKVRYHVKMLYIFRHQYLIIKKFFFKKIPKNDIP